MTSDVAIRQGLVARLATIDGLTAYPFKPGRVNVPAAVVERKLTAFDATMGRGSDDFTYGVTIVVSWAEPEVAQAAMSVYLDTASSESIKAVIEGEATLGGVVDFARVREAGAETLVEIAGQLCLTVEFLVEVTA